MSQSNKKRKTETQLTRDSVDDEETTVDPGKWQQAKPEELAKRRIVKARRPTKRKQTEQQKPAPKLNWNFEIETKTEEKPKTPEKPKEEQKQEAEKKEVESTKTQEKPKEEQKQEAKAEEKAEEKKEEDKKEDKKEEKTEEKKEDKKEEKKEETGGFKFDFSQSPFGKVDFNFSFGTDANFSFGSIASQTGGSTSEAFSTGTFNFSDSVFGSTPAWSADYTPSEEKKDKPVVELSNEPVITGEEDDENIQQFRAKLYQLQYIEKEKKSEWKERGVGTLKLNKMKEGGHRLIMRTDAAFRLILNIKLFPELKIQKKTDKSVLLSTLDEKQQVVSYLLKFNKKEICDEMVELVNKHKQ